MDQKLIGLASPEQITAWKELVAKQGKNARLHVYIVDGRICYLRSVDRQLYSVATTKISQAPALYQETLINGVWLGGDETIRQDDQYYFGLADEVESLMGKKKGALGEA